MNASTASRVLGIIADAFPTSKSAAAYSRSTYLQSRSYHVDQGLTYATRMRRKNNSQHCCSFLSEFFFCCGICVAIAALLLTAYSALTSCPFFRPQRTRGRKRADFEIHCLRVGWEGVLCMFSEAIDRTCAKVQHVLCGHKNQVRPSFFEGNAPEKSS